MPTAFPEIYSKNYINSDGVDTFSTGASVGLRIHDWDQASKWASVGSNDARLETFDHEFFEEGSAINRTFDTVILLNHNLKNWRLQYWDGSAWQDTTAAYSVDAGSNTFTTITEIVNRAKVRLHMEKTQVANQEKSVGELIVCNLDFTFPQYIDAGRKAVLTLCIQTS